MRRPASLDTAGATADGDIADASARGAADYATYYAPQLTSAIRNVSALPPALRALFEREMAALSHGVEGDRA